MRSVRSISIYSLTAFALVATVCLAGCGNNLEHDPLFQETFKLVRELNEDSKVMTRRVDDVSMAVTSLRTRVESVQRMPTGSAESLHRVETRVAALEKALVASTRQVALLQTRLEKQAKAARAAQAGSGSIRSTSSDSTEKSSSRRAVVRRIDSPKPKPARPRGTYHLVAEGESIEEIARRTSVEPRIIYAANRIPEGRVIFAGQQIFVPAR